MLSPDGTLSYYPGDNPRYAPLGSVDLRVCTELRGPSECGDWGSDVPRDTRADARLGVVTDARTYRLLCDTPENAAYWLTKLRAEWARVKPEANAELSPFVGKVRRA